MQIIDFEPVAQRGGNVRAVATFNLQLTPDVRLYGCRLMEAADGNRFIYAAQVGPRRAATFAKPLAEQITVMASDLYRKALTAHDRQPA